MGASSSKSGEHEVPQSGEHAAPKKPKDFPTNDRSRDGVPIFLNVYDLQDTTQGGRKRKGETFNSALGFGFYHSGVEVFGVEWSFGGMPDAPPKMPGIFPVRPRCALPPTQFHRQVKLGEIVGLTTNKVIEVLRGMEKDWPACSYHVLNHNCNHFGEAFLHRLSTEFGVHPPMKAPAWVNRAARFGDVVVPERIYNAMMRRAPRPPPGPADYQFNPQTAPPFYQQSAQTPGSASSCSSASGESATPHGGPGFVDADTRIPLVSAEEMKNMSVRDIKAMMWSNGISWDECVEKQDLINAVVTFKRAQEELDVD